jgi:hypothetical protein
MDWMTAGYFGCQRIYTLSWHLVNSETSSSNIPMPTPNMLRLKMQVKPPGYSEAARGLLGIIAEKRV